MLPDTSILIGHWHKVSKLKNSKETFWMIFKQCGKQASEQKTYKSQQNVTFQKVYDFLAEKLVKYITYVIWLISEWNIHTGVISWQADISGNAGAADDIF